jgi:hypothetical protein
MSRLKKKAVSLRPGLCAFSLLAQLLVVHVYDGTQTLHLPYFAMGIGIIDTYEINYSTGVASQNVAGLVQVNFEPWLEVRSLPDAITNHYANIFGWGVYHTTTVGTTYHRC